jgi:hypothetical protein
MRASPLSESIHSQVPRRLLERFHCGLRHCAAFNIDGLKGRMARKGREPLVRQFRMGEPDVVEMSQFRQSPRRTVADVSLIEAN